jgi:hypothetical protein
MHSLFTTGNYILRHVGSNCVKIDMYFATKAIVICSLLVAAFREVNSFPTAAGGCAGGVAAVGGSHLGEVDARVVSNSTLETGGVFVQIGNITLDSTTPLDLAILEDHTIAIISTEFPIRGILIRVEADGADTSAILTPGLQTQPATACVAPIVGTTHIDSTDKSELTSVIRFDESLDSVILDITGVFVNSPSGSVYVYSRYIVNFVSTTPSTSVPSEAPTSNEIPTVVPLTSMPTISPVEVETEAPSASPLNVETQAPTAAPISMQTASPTKTPVAAETMIPTSSPIVTTKEPTVSPLQAPSVTESPVPTAIEKTPEPSLRGKGKMNGKGMGMMSNVMDDSSPTKAPHTTKKEMMKGMMMNESGKEKKPKYDMKKSKDEVDNMDQKHSMAKISKETVK